MKKKYICPELTVVPMDGADVIVTSLKDNQTSYGGRASGGDAEAPQRRGGIWEDE